MSCGDNSNAIVPHRVRYVQQATSGHTEPDVTTLAVVLAEVFTFDREDIGKSQPCGLEAHAMSREVRSRLRIVPFEIIASHCITTAKP